MDLMERYEMRREAFINYLGGKCNRCGVTDGLEFDHVDRTTKEFTIAKRMVSMNLDELKVEIDKCQLLCNECHKDKSREAGDFGDVEHGGGSSGKRNCPCEPCKAKKAEFMVAKREQYNSARKAKRASLKSKSKEV